MSTKDNKHSVDMREVMKGMCGHPAVERRIKALKKLQFERLEVEGQLTREVFALSDKFGQRYRELDSKRRQIIAGEVEPSDSDCEGLPLESMQVLAKELPQNTDVNVADIRGIPGFWLKTMQSVDEIDDWIEATDEEVLYHLSDIRYSLSPNRPQITLEFHFNENDYFSNQVLTKTYAIEFGPNPADPWHQKKYYPIERKGCAIDWKDGKNVTKQAKKDKKSSGNSFFDFFDDSKLKNPSKADKNAEDIEDDLEDDWCLAEALVKNIIPNAVLYFNGDVSEDCSDSSSDSSDESESTGSESED